MKISCIQMDMQFCSPNENYLKAEKLIADAMKEKPDVVVLPETWNTGFFPHNGLEKLSDNDGCRTKELMSKLAKKFNVNIVAGSVANVKNGKVYNTCYVFSRNGDVLGEYDKTHLFTPMNEDGFFQKGDNLFKFTLDGHSCAVIICYDIRFPELTRKLSVSGLDFLFIVAQWPDIRVPHLQVLSQARAIENQMFVVCCNSCGKADKTTYGGHSRIVDPWGVVLCEANGAEATISAECDTSVLKNIRETINVFRDRRPELY